MIQSHTQIKFKEFSFQLWRVSSHFKSKLTDRAAIFLYVNLSQGFRRMWFGKLQSYL